MEKTGADYKGIKLLYVEDETEIREIICENLLEEYPEVLLFTAGSGAEGLALFREHRPEVVITDIKMPGMDGIQMAGEIKAMNPEVILIALTAYSDTDFLLSAIEIGFSHYVMKPIDFDKLYEPIVKSFNIIKLKQQVDEQNEQIRQFAADLEKRVEERTRELHASRIEVENKNSKLRELTRELRASRNLYWNLYNWSPLGYLSIDDQFIIREVNITGARLLGSRRAKLLGTSMHQYLSQENMDLLSESLQSCIQTKHAVTEVRMTVQEKKHLFVQIHCVPYTLHSKDFKLYRTAIIDITRLKEAEESLRLETMEKLNAIEELRKRDQMLIQQGHFAAIGELLSNISHHWRQPLNVLGLLVQDLPLAYENGALSQEYLETSSAKAMEVISGLSQTLSNFGYYFQSGQQKVTFNIREIMARAVTLIEASLKEQHLTLEVVYEGDLVIEGVERDFFQVLLNMIMNTRDICLERKVEKPRIDVRMSSEVGKSVISITDNAGGIPEEIIGRIFDPYFTTKETSHGSGVGLYMAKIIIENNMNGSLTVKNRDGGAEFRIELNIANT